MNIIKRLNNAERDIQIMMFDCIALTNWLNDNGHEEGSALQDKRTNQSFADIRENMLAGVMKAIAPEIGVNTNEFYQLYERLDSAKVIKTTSGFNFY